MVTYPGDSLASRAAGSFALTAGFPEFLVYSWTEYKDKAVAFATTKQAEYQQLRKALNDARETMPLFDTRYWVRCFEHALEVMYGLQGQNLPLTNIYVPILPR